MKGVYSRALFLEKGGGFRKCVISQTPKHVQDIFDFNMTSNPHGYLALFVPKTLSVVGYLIIDLITSKVCG